LRCFTATDLETPFTSCTQGSDDGAAWSDLRTHAHDGSICAPGQFHSWPVEQGALRFFRHFRVRLTPREDSVRLPICFIELYGYLL